MELTRRGFISACGAAAVSSLAAHAVTAPLASAGSRKLMIEELTPDLFRQHVGQTFHVSDGTGRSEGLALAEVDDRGEQALRKGAPRIHTFAVYLEGPADAALPQGVYTLSHPEMGTVEGLFLVPVVAQEPGKASYELVFSRLVGQPGEGVNHAR